MLVDACEGGRGRGLEPLRRGDSSLEETKTGDRTVGVC